MPTLVLRVDLRCLPWDPDSEHEIAAVLNMLDAARRSGLRYHFLMSAATARALPMMIEAILSEGHLLHPLIDQPEDEASLRELFGLAGHRFREHSYALVTTEWPTPPNFRPTKTPTVLRLGPLAGDALQRFENQVLTWIQSGTPLETS